MQARNSLMLAALMLLASSPALAQTMTDDMSQTGPQSVTGARPGNDIGTRDSLPRSPAASNITSADTNSTIAPTPPEPSVGPDAGVNALLSSANQSLATGETGQANEALEQAETQILQRSVLKTQTDYTSTDPVVAQIDQARLAIGNRDNEDATRIIDQILSGGSPELSE
ncbi:MAG TPA: hypothetical protein VEQ16_02560 [Acidocella sp.]|jgi:hypothetical protein|nr:hypothetical protein [Acidocella sp.]